VGRDAPRCGGGEGNRWALTPDTKPSSPPSRQEHGDVRNQDEETTGYAIPAHTGLQDARQPARVVAGARDRRAVETVCCFTDTWRDTDAGIDPNSSSAEPSWEAHEHGPGCEATRVQQVIRTERREGNAGWRTTCLSCDWINIYYCSPGRQDAKGQPVLREGSVRYQYPLSARPVPQRHRDLAPTTGSAGHGSRPRDLRRRHTPLTHWSCG
jgi:hypothetical protein